MADVIPDAATCLGCGFPVDSSNPIPSRCGACPPVRCDDCGQIDAMDSPCQCWVSVSDLPLAELKGIFALGGLSVSTPPNSTEGDDRV